VPFAKRLAGFAHAPVRLRARFPESHLLLREAAVGEAISEADLKPHRFMELAAQSAMTARFAALVARDVHVGWEKALPLESWLEHALELGELGAKFLAELGQGVTFHAWVYIN